MKIHVVSAQVSEYQWRAIRAFLLEEEADEYAEKVYSDGCVRNERVFDTRVDEVVLEKNMNKED